MTNSGRTPKEKELLTTIAVKKLEVKKLEKELARLENEENQTVWRKYET